MKHTSILTLIGLLASGYASAHAMPGETSEHRITARFAVSSAEIDSVWQVRQELDSLMHTLRSDSLLRLTHVSISGSSSPDGPLAQNLRLASGRAEAMAAELSRYPLPDSIVAAREDWELRAADFEGLRNLITESGEFAGKERVLEVLAGDPTKAIGKLKAMDRGAVYERIKADFLPQLRSATLTFDILATSPQPEEQAEVQTEYVAEEPESLPVITPQAAPMDKLAQWRKLRIKTNAAAWALAISNLAFEIDLMPHFSLALPLYYSAWEYGSHRVKFRTCAFQPEVRFWKNADNNGFFAGAHFGVAQYNFALGGRYRFQDHDGKTPALGAGVSLGYRHRLGRSERWQLEWSIGAGVYRLHYDAFDNSSVEHGQKVYEKKKTFGGIDNVGISFIYTIPLGRKGGAL